MDAEKSQSLSRQIIVENTAALQAISCTLGTDNLTNVAGILEGDLSPIHGMYWTWQSGYINFKLEGSSPYCNTRKNEFQYHLGGYLQPLATAQPLYFDISKSRKKIILRINLEQFVQSIDLTIMPTIMSPSTHAVQLSEQAKKTFSIYEP
jgi:hypothetical protein